LSGDEVFTIGFCRPCGFKPAAGGENTVPTQQLHVLVQSLSRKTIAWVRMDMSHNEYDACLQGFGSERTSVYKD
jgi:hypothetical protein